MAELEDEISSLCSEIHEFKIGTFEKFYDAMEGEMEGCCVNIVFFGMTGSGKSALINTIFQSLGYKYLNPAVTQTTGKEGTKVLDRFFLPGNQIALVDTRGFFSMDNNEEVELFRILFGMDRPGDDLTRDEESALKAKAAGQGAHRLEKPPLADQMHVVIWVIKANDIRFEKGQYREVIKYVQDQLREATITILTVITFDDEVQREPNADEKRKRLKEAAVEVTGSDMRNVFMIANSLREQDLDPVYKKRVLKLMEKALKCGERSIKMRQTKRESPKKEIRHSESAAGELKYPTPVEHEYEPPTDRKCKSLPPDFKSPELNQSSTFTRNLRDGAK
ncbi:unnamed protein product [Pocillopora meandrina]|uniref:G domain-containing protein n=1 Tax=Pocillopora meandrina TaxID=46732 RepID=A0AAU9WMQ2_9CNID|nr:unnamed protein product [Pocillopora meandrina]